MTATQDQPRKTYGIVVGVDYSELGDLALERACEFGQAHDQAHLHVVHVTRARHTPAAGKQDTASDELAQVSTRLRDHVEEVIRRWCETRSLPMPFARVITHVRSDGAAEAIAQLASDVQADLAVVGTHGRRGVRRLVLGSVAEATIRLAPCAVLVVRPPDASTPEIEPPCPRCLETRSATHGRELWCEQHREHHDKRHTYHYAGDPDPRQSGLLIHLA